MEKIIDDIIDRAGSKAKLARHLGIKHSSLYNWRRVPAARVIEIEKLTGISRHKIRPDIFGCGEHDGVLENTLDGGFKE